MQLFQTIFYSLADTTSECKSCSTTMICCSELLLKNNTVTLRKGVFILLFKVWDAVDTGCCLQTYSCHSCAVRAARWSSCGRRILSGGFDSMLHLTDVETGKGHEECVITISLLCTDNLGSC